MSTRARRVTADVTLSSDRLCSSFVEWHDQSTLFPARVTPRHRRSEAFMTIRAPQDRDLSQGHANFLRTLRRRCEPAAVRAPHRSHPAVSPGWRRHRPVTSIIDRQFPTRLKVPRCAWGGGIVGARRVATDRPRAPSACVRRLRRGALRALGLTAKRREAWPPSATRNTSRSVFPSRAEWARCPRSCRSRT